MTEVRTWLFPIVASRTRVCIVSLFVYSPSWLKFNRGVHLSTPVTLGHVYHTTDNCVSVRIFFKFIFYFIRVLTRALAHKLTHTNSKLLPNGAGLILFSTFGTSWDRTVIWYNLMPPPFVKTLVSWFTVRTAKLPPVLRAFTSPTNRHLGSLEFLRKLKSLKCSTTSILGTAWIAEPPVYNYILFFLEMCI